MIFPIELFEVFEACITDSIIDSILEIEKQFIITKNSFGDEVAIRSLAMAFIISENRRRYVEGELLVCNPD